MSLRVAFDLDGVLADMDAALARAAEGLFHEKVPRRRDPVAPPIPTTAAEVDVAAEEKPAEASEGVPPLLRLELTARQSRQLWRHVRGIENFWETLDELEPGAIARLAGVAAERRWEVIFLTRRPESAGSTAQRQTQRWLVAKGFALPSVFVVNGSRGRIAAALGIDVVVDDRPENCLDVVADSHARAILVWRDAEAMLPQAAKRLGIAVAGSVDECLDMLVTIDTPEPRKSGVVHRVKKMLGRGAGAASV